MRLIDADAYKKYLDDNWIVANHDAIDAQPTIDAVEVVRCKDCKFYEPFTYDTTGKGHCLRVKNYGMYLNDFCSYGERKKND